MTFNFSFDAESSLALVATINGAERKFGRLTMRDFAELNAMMPNPKASFNAVFDWSMSPAGIIATVHLSAAKYDPVFTPAEAEAWPVDVLYDLAAEIRRVSGGSLIGPAKESADPNAEMMETAGMQNVRG